MSFPSLTPDFSCKRPVASVYWAYFQQKLLVYLRRRFCRTHEIKFSSLGYGLCKALEFELPTLTRYLSVPSLENRRLSCHCQFFFNYSSSNLLPSQCSPNTPLIPIMINNILFLLYVQITQNTHFYLILSLYGIIYLQKLLIVPLFLCLSIILCHSFCNVIVLPWVHCYISSWLFVYPLHLCINFYRKKNRAAKRETFVQFHNGMETLLLPSEVSGLIQ